MTSPMDVPIAPRARRTTWRTGAAVAAALAALLLIVLIARRTSPSVTVDRATLVIARVERGPLLREARGTGTLVADRSRLVAAETSGRVEAIRVGAGDRVEPSSPIIVLSNAEAEEQAADARAARQFAEAELAGARAELTQQLMALRAEVAQLEGELEEASARAQSLGELAKDGLTSSEELHVARVRAESLSTRADLARQRLAAARSGVEAQLAAKKASLAQADARARLRGRVAESLAVKALLGGSVQEILVEIGQQVAPGQNLARIADPSALIARVHIPPSQARDVVPGLEARVDTHGGIVAGRVMRVDPAVRDGAVTVDIALAGPIPSGVRPDSSVEATIVRGRVADTLFVQRPVNVEEGATAQLFRVDPNGAEARRVRVTIGRGSATAMEVLDGLRQGDQVIVSDTTAWQDESRIRIR